MGNSELEVNLREHRHLDALQALESVVTVTGNHIADYREDIIIADTTAGNLTVTLPKARGGKVFHVVKSKAANTLTIVFSGTETMLGLASITITDFGAGKRLKAVLGGYIPL